MSKREKTVPVQQKWPETLKADAMALAAKLDSNLTDMTKKLWRQFNELPRSKLRGIKHQTTIIAPPDATVCIPSLSLDFGHNS